MYGASLSGRHGLYVSLLSKIKYIYIYTKIRGLVQMWEVVFVRNVIKPTLAKYYNSAKNN